MFGNIHEGRRDRGAAAVEMALVMPLLVLFAFGIIDMGRLFNAEIQLSQAAREGARIAALGYPYDTDAAERRAQDAAPAPGFGGSGTIKVEPPATMCAVSPAIGSNGTVTVTYPFTFFLPFLPEMTLTQTAVMRCAG